MAYGSVLQDRRRELHAKVVETMEGLYSDRITEQVERLAHHAFRGEVWEKAVRYLRQAGAKAFERSANLENVAYLNQALAALAHLPESRETLEQAIDLRFELRNSLFPFRVQRDADHAARRRTPGDGARRFAQAGVGVGADEPVLLGHRSLEGSARLRRAWRGARPHARRSRARGVANYYAGAACFASTDYAQAEVYLRRAVPSFAGALGRERFGLAGYPAVMSRWLLASCLAERGSFGEGLACAQEGLRIAEEVRHPYSLILASWGVALALTLQGEFDRASAQLAHALALCRDWSVAALTPVTAGFLAYVHALSGRIAEGLSSLQQAKKDLESSGLALYDSRLTLWLGEAFMRAGRLEEALAHAERAAALTRERGEHGLSAWAQFLLGEIASRRDLHEAQSAEAHYVEALALAGKDGLEPLVARCHDSLGKLYRRVGKQPQAREHVAEATAMYAAMDMRFWKEQTDAESAALG